MNVKAHAAIPKYVVEAKEEFVSDKKMRKKQTGSFLFRGPPNTNGLFPFAASTVALTARTATPIKNSDGNVSFSHVGP